MSRNREAEGCLGIIALVVIIFIIGLIIKVGEFVYNNAFLFIFLFLMVAGIIVFFKSSTSRSQKEKKQAKEKAENRRLVSQILKVTTQSNFKNYTSVRNLDWVYSHECINKEELDFDLRLKAAKKKANALIYKKSKKEKNGRLSGKAYAVIIEDSRTANSGNIPYLPRETILSGEVLSENKSKKFGWVALDGNNIFGEINEQVDDPHESFKIFKKFINQLENSPYKFILFWDSNFWGFAMTTGLIDKKKPNVLKSQQLKDLLSDLLRINESKILISQEGINADDPLITWAHKNNAAVVSNDNFKKKDGEDYQIYKKADNLRKQDLLKKFQCITSQVIVPGLTELK